jgi:hypothetical protein
MLTRLARGYTYDAPRRQGFLDNTVVVRENVNKIPSLKQPTGSNFADRANSRQGFKRSDPRPRFVDVDLGNQLEASKQGLKVSLSEKTVKDIAGASKDVISIESFLQSSQARTPEGIQLLLDAVKSLSGVERQQLNEAIGDSGDKVAVKILQGLNSIVSAPPAPPLTGLPPTNQNTDEIKSLLQTNRAKQMLRQAMRRRAGKEEGEELPDWVEDDFKNQSELKDLVNKMKTSRQDKKEELPDWAKFLFRAEKTQKEIKQQIAEKKAQKEIDDDLASFLENLEEEMMKTPVKQKKTLRKPTPLKTENDDMLNVLGKQGRQTRQSTIILKRLKLLEKKKLPEGQVLPDEALNRIYEFLGDEPKTNTAGQDAGQKRRRKKNRKKNK